MSLQGSIREINDRLDFQRAVAATTLILAALEAFPDCETYTPSEEDLAEYRAYCAEIDARQLDQAERDRYEDQCQAHWAP